jgi:NAD(P)-dependent dehydrogenase (short-subunit alcohol dehydrogenase family)
MTQFPPQPFPQSLQPSSTPLSYSGPIVITGANGGIGSALVASLLAAGIRNLACHYHRSAGRIAKVLADYDLGENCLFRADLTSEAEVGVMAAIIQARLGAPWGIINLAGSTTNSISWKLSLDDFNHVLQTNLTSTFLTTRAFLPAMRERDGGPGGRIINISSVVAHTGIPGTSPYCAAKSAIEGFTRVVAMETASRRITVNALALGYFDKGIIAEVPEDVLDGIKERIPLKRLGRVAEVSALVRYLLSAESEYMTGQVLHLNGGLWLG